MGHAAYIRSKVPPQVRPLLPVLRAAALIILITAGGAWLPARAQDAGPEALVRSTTDEVLAVVRQNHDKATIRRLAEDKVLPHFDFTAMTRLAAGRHWREATPQQQEALQQAFRTLLVNTYVNAISRSATGQEKVSIKPGPPPSGDEATVRTVGENSGSQPVEIDYRMRRSGAEWLVIDVAVENVSLVTTYRGTFDAEIQRGGVDGLIKALQDKNRALPS